MPCHAAMMDKPLTLSPDTEIEKALAELKKKKRDFAAVVDEDGVLIGLFSLYILMRNLLPVSVAVTGGIPLDIPIKAAPGIAKRLRKVYPLKVQELMERKKINTVYPQTPIWECINSILTHGSPVMVIEDDQGKFLGAITERSAFEELQRLQESDK